MKCITVLGSTGSIGTQTLDVVRFHKKDFQIFALTAGSNITLLEKQIREFSPAYACLWKEEDAKELEKRVGDCSTKVIFGMDGLVFCSENEKVDIVVAAMVGMIGLQPVMAAIEAKKDIALANKETLVTAGHLIMPLVKEKGVNLLPVDSEHSAIFQCIEGLNGDQKSQIDTIYLTASGGPFRNHTREQIEKVTVEDALKHPNWSMGNKITIDSATMMNKGLEVLEASWLFNLPLSRIQVLVQPQSIIHSMVQMTDGAVMAQLGTPDMKLPIQYALTYPTRKELPGERLDFSEISAIQFEKPNTDVLEGLQLACEAGRIGGSMPTVMNAANEFAVAAFLKKEIRFTEIYRMIDFAMSHHLIVKNPSLRDILEVEEDTYNMLKDWRKR